MTATKTEPHSHPGEVRVPVGDDFAILSRLNIWLTIFVVLVLIVASTTAAVESLRLVARYSQQNAVHRARNEAAHICIAEIFGEARHLAKNDMDWSARDSLAFYESCVDQVARTLSPPDSVTGRLRFVRPGRVPFSITVSPQPSHEAPQKTSSQARDIYVPTPATYAPRPSASHHNSPTPGSTPTPSPRRTPAPTPDPAPCDPACVPSPPAP